MMRDSHVSKQLSDIMKNAFASTHGGYYGSCCYAYKSITDAERGRNGEYTMKVVYKSKDAIDVKRINDAIKRIDGNITQSKAEIAIA